MVTLVSNPIPAGGYVALVCINVACRPICIALALVRSAFVSVTKDDEDVMRQFILNQSKIEMEKYVAYCEF
ncbi:hypothetical protein BLOT_009220 [Blomia tropicalis]|nr:hypothetical protein BLOT_009220 [Blomia tropicalis]